MNKFYFTLSSNHGGPGCIEVLAQDYMSARKTMNDLYGTDWAFQYDSLEKVHIMDRDILATIGYGE